MDINNLTKSREIRQLLRKTLPNYPHILPVGGKRHHKLRNTLTAKTLPIPYSPSDTRAFLNFRLALRRFINGKPT